MNFFPEIKNNETLVTNVIREEEASFLRTLDQGLQVDKVIAETNGKSQRCKSIPTNYMILLVSIDLTA
jgi:alanyl-tRNA synthetase